MALISIAAFATAHGVTKQAAYKWRNNGWLVLVDGLVDIDPTNERLAQYRDRDAIQARRSATKAAKTPPVPPVPVRATVAPQVGVYDHGPDIEAAHRRRVAAAAAADVAAGASAEAPEAAADRLVRLMAAELTTEEARRVKENYLALRGKLEYERDAGDLVAMQTAETVLFEQFRAVRNAWLSWPSNFGAEIAADLNVDADRVTEVLTGYVHRQIDELGEPNGRFGKN